MAVGGRALPRHRRPRPSGDDAHRRRRHALQRRTGLRPATDHPARALRYARRLGIETAASCIGSMPAVLAQQFSRVSHFDLAETDPSKGSRPRGADFDPDEEERLFSRTMSDGADRVGEAIAAARREAGRPGKGASPSAGRPSSTSTTRTEFRSTLIEEIAGDEGVAVDRPGFEEEMEAQRDRSQAGSRFEARTHRLSEDGQIDPSGALGVPRISGAGLRRLDREGSSLVSIVEAGREAARARTGRRRGRRRWTGRSSTPRAAGRSADTGALVWDGGAGEVTWTSQKPCRNLIAHRVRVVEGGSRRVRSWT